MSTLGPNVVGIMICVLLLGRRTRTGRLSPLVDSTQALELEENGGQEKGRRIPMKAKTRDLDDNDSPDLSKECMSSPNRRWIQRC